MIQKLWSIKLSRFICVGVFNTALDFTLLNLFVFAFHLPVIVANSFSVCIGVTVSYVLNRRYVFRETGSPSLKSFVKFFLVTGLSVLVIQTLVISIMTPTYTHLLDNVLNSFRNRSLLVYEEKLSLNLAKMTAVLVGMIWNYMLYSKIVFKKNSKIEDLTD